MATDRTVTSRNPTTAAILSSTGKISSGKVFLVLNKDTLCYYVTACRLSGCVREHHVYRCTVERCNCWVQYICSPKPSLDPDLNIQMFSMTQISQGHKEGATFGDIQHLLLQL